jgi:hypothetical protein
MKRYVAALLVVLGVVGLVGVLAVGTGSSVPAPRVWRQGLTRG